jgi:hypothetical protein
LEESAGDYPGAGKGALQGSDSSLMDCLKGFIGAVFTGYIKR